MSSSKNASRKRRQAAAKRKAANERRVQREQAEKERLDALRSNDSAGTEEPVKTEPVKPVNDGTEKKQPTQDNTEKKQSTDGNKPVKKQKTDAHKDAVNAYRKAAMRKERREKRMRVIIGIIVCVAMIVPVGAASIASLLNLQNGVPTDYNTQTTNSSTFGDSKSGTDVKNMTEEERKALIEQYPGIVSNDKEKEEFIKNGTVPKNTKSTDGSANTNGNKSSDTGSMTNDDSKTTTNPNSQSEKK